MLIFDDLLFEVIYFMFLKKLDIEIDGGWNLRFMNFGGFYED